MVWFTQFTQSRFAQNVSSILGKIKFHLIYFSSNSRFTKITFHPTHVSPKLHLLKSFPQFLFV